MNSLKTALWICALGCLTAIPFIVLPWGIIEAIMMAFGLKSIPEIPEIPAVMYFMRIACGVLGLVGIFFIMLARNPLDYGPMLNLGAYGLIVFGLLALVLGLRLRISPMVFLGDTLFGIVLGVVVAVLSFKARSVSETKAGVSR